MADTHESNGRTHEPALRELVANVDGLRDLMDERDKRYTELRKDDQNALEKALSAQEKQTNAAFAASEKAIVKQEEAQKDYNDRSNEFRGALDDANKKNISRDEANSRFSGVDEKYERLREEIQNLRESRSEGTGAKAQEQDNSRITLAVAAIVSSGLIAVAGVIVAILLHR